MRIITYNLFVVNVSRRGCMPFNRRLREIRMEKHMTQQQLADAIHVELRSYQCYEQGTREPHFQTLIVIADVLNVTTDRLLCRDEKQ